MVLREEAASVALSPRQAVTAGAGARDEGEVTPNSLAAKALRRPQQDEVRGDHPWHDVLSYIVVPNVVIVALVLAQFGQSSKYAVGPTVA